MLVLNSKNKLFTFSETVIMGIINCTPDSFYQNSRLLNKDFKKEIDKMVIDKVDIIDIGGYSSRPGAKDISIQEEIDRVLPAIEYAHSSYPDLLISLDTFRSEVAKEGIMNGAGMINDISAGNLDEDIFKVISYFNVPYCMMHMRGTPQTMMQNVTYDHLINELIDYFQKRILICRSLNINDIILDVGIGFSKTLDQNYELLANIDSFSILNLPLLVGVSRKSLLYKTFNTTPEYSLNSTTALHSLLMNKKVSIFRVHDVKEIKEIVKLRTKLDT